MRDQIKQELLAVVAYDEASPSCLVWNHKAARRIKPGQPAGTRTPNGYWLVGYRGRKYLAHHLVWELHGNAPAALLDHRDNNGFNNRIANLRPATDSQNQHNRGKQHNNTTGVKGLGQHGNSWYGRIQYGGKHYTYRNANRQVVEDWLLTTRASLAGEFAHD